MIKRVKNTVPWTYVISDIKGEETVGIFYEKELQIANQKGFRVEKVIKKKAVIVLLTVGSIKKDSINE